MLRFLFWNVCRRPVESIVANLVRQHDIDVLILTESILSEGAILHALSKEGQSSFGLTDSRCTTTAIYTRFPIAFLESVYEVGDRLTIRRLLLPGCPEVLLVAAHLPSKLHWSDDSQGHECIRVAQRIREVEERAGHDRTILVGDLNMNPFEAGIVSSAGLNATMTRTVASRRSRTVQGEDYPFFYNPMWGHFGDAEPGPSGTYYYPSSEHVAYYWNMFDQVLLRPSVADRFNNEDLYILTTDGTVPLVTKSGLPDKTVGSDHLPILFGLNL